MDQSPLGQLPGEIRNEIYKLVHDDVEELEVRIDARGVAEDGLRGKFALATACKQLRQETEGFPMTETNTIILKPNFSTTKYGNKTLTALFDLDTWLKSVKGNKNINPKRIVLLVGELEVANLPSMRAWQIEVERIVNRIPLEGLKNPNFEFAIDVAISAQPLPAHHHTLPLQDGRADDGCAAIMKAMVAGVRTQKREASSLLVKEWENMEKTALAARRAELWGLLHLAQHALPYVLQKLYHSLFRVEKGYSRHPTAVEQKDARWRHWLVHD